jgi:protein TonB
MKFIKLESRGGNYLVVAENVAWLRVAENGQTSVGIIGGQPLLVVGSLEEVAAKLLEATGSDEAQEQQAPAVQAMPAPSPEPQPEPAPAAEVAQQPQAAATRQADIAPAPQIVAQPVADAVREPAPKPAPTIVNLSLKAAPSAGGTSLSERLAAARPKLKAGAAD